jgi:hypothetical protein
VEGVRRPIVLPTDDDIDVAGGHVIGHGPLGAALRDCGQEIEGLLRVDPARRGRFANTLWCYFT